MNNNRMIATGLGVAIAILTALIVGNLITVAILFYRMSTNDTTCANDELPPGIFPNPPDDIQPAAAPTLIPPTGWMPPAEDSTSLGFLLCMAAFVVITLGAMSVMLMHNRWRR